MPIYADNWKPSIIGLIFISPSPWTLLLCETLHFSWIHFKSNTCTSWFELEKFWKNTPCLVTDVLGVQNNNFHIVYIKYLWYHLFIFVYLIYYQMCEVWDVTNKSSWLLSNHEVIIRSSCLISHQVPIYKLSFNFYTPVWKTGRIMPWQCPSVRLSVCPSVCPSVFSGLFFNMLWDINLKLGIYIQ